MKKYVVTLLLLSFFSGNAQSPCTPSFQDVKFKTTLTSAGTVFASGSSTANYTSIGNPAVDVTMNVSGNTGDLKASSPSATDDGLSVGMVSTNISNAITVTFTFSQPVENLTFRLYDVDRSTNGLNYRDSVLIQGYNNGVYIPASVAANNSGYLENTDWKQTNNGSNLAISGLSSVSGKYVEITFPTGTGANRTGTNQIVITYTNSPGTVLPPSSTLGQTISIGNLCWNSTAPLPVNLVSFQARQQLDGTELFWQTTDEVNNDFFVIERSFDGRAFESIGRVEGTGTTEEFISYNFIDTFPKEGYNYYRLRQHDFDGSTHYSKIISQKFIAEEPLVQVFPNPIKQGESLTLKTRKIDASSLVIYNEKGQVLPLIITEFANELQVQLPANLLVNQLFLKAKTTDNQFITKRIVVF